MNYRNIPQLAIQAIYIIDTGSFDIIVCNAMIFSIFSIVYRIFQAILRKSRQNSLVTKAEYHYRVHELYAMKIVCDKFQSYHRFSHNTMTDILCSIFRIDNSSNNIEIFYIYSIRQGLIIYLELSNYGIDKSKLDLFSSILKISDNQEGALSEIFKMELDKRLNFGIKNANIDGQIDRARSRTVNYDEIIGDRIKIFVKHENKRLAVDKDAVIVDSNSAPVSQPHSPVVLLRQISSNFFGHHEQPQSSVA